MAVSHATYEQVALEDSDTVWEYVCGQLRAKPGMTQEHVDVAFYLAHMIASQVDKTLYRVRSNAGRVRAGSGNEYVPDVLVVPAETSLAQRGNLQLEAFDGPVPFVAEVWSRSTAAHDIDNKIPDYLSRGDGVVWRIHPYERTIHAWERQDDGTYLERQFSGGTAQIPSLPGVVIEVPVLFE
jgi:Uma2 family endonuclease